MGIFPTHWSPIHMISPIHDEYDEKIIKEFEQNCVILSCWQDIDLLTEIDKWVRDNMRNHVYYTERFPKRAPVWQQYFYFSDTEDLVAFKLRWL